MSDLDGTTGDSLAHDPLAIYRERIARHAAERDALDRRSTRAANLSVALFVGIFAAILAGVWLQQALLFVLAIAVAIGFVANVARHTWIDGQQRRAAELVAIDAEGLARIERAWDRLPQREPPITIDEQHPYAADLDVTGRASLMHLLNTAATPVGQTTLLRWLTDPAPLTTIRQRQAAVAELAPLIDLRDGVAQRGRLLLAEARQQRSYERFAEWAAGEPWLLQRPWLIWLSRIVPPITIALMIADAIGVLGPLWVVGLVINFVVIMTAGKQVDAIIERVAARQGVFRIYADLFRLVGTQRLQSPLLRDLQARLSAGNVRADEQMQRLGRRVAFADFRYFLFFFVIKLVTLWNVHALWLLERWQRVAGRQAPGWLAALGEIEALVALATLRFDHPDWCFPELADDDPLVLAAESLGHPLLPPARRVDNDVSIGPAGTFLLITGSNMSGKSTLLRAIGANVVLAQAGGPVCAARLRLPPLRLATSMRVQDSLQQGISLFMAELSRIKLIVDLADRDGERPLLYLLDEILHGTNTAERRVAVRQIVRHLLDRPAIGAISTHDLSIARDAEIAESARLAHFTEQFSRSADGPTMRFDYRLRPGLSTSTNALKLMELIGLPIDAAETSASSRDG